MIDKMSNASRLVDKLLAKGLVVRITSKEDRRRVDISITETGLQVVAEASATLEKEMKLDKGYLTCEEAEELNRLLDKIRTLHEEEEALKGGD